jgi:hypothetical protein
LINVILDTNILRQEGLSSRNMQLLKRLALAAHIKIYIPEIVKREFLTRMVLDATEKLQEASKNISFVTKKISKDNELYPILTEIEEDILPVHSRLEKEFDNDFDKWLSNYKATIVPFEPNCMKDVLDEYFQGSGVFRKPKSREDIPDAIINSSINKLLGEKGKLTVIIKDGAFRKHLESIEHISIYSSLDEFLSFKENKEKLEQLDALSDKVESFKEFFASTVFSTNLLKFLQDSDEIIENIYLEADQIQSKGNLEIDSFGESVNSPKAEDISDLHISKVAWLSDGVFSLEISFTTNAVIDFCGYYHDYMSTIEGSGRDIFFNSMNGEGICDLGEVRNLVFVGYIQLTIDEHSSVDEIKVHSNYLGSVPSPIGIDLEIKSAEIL